MRMIFIVVAVFSFLVYNHLHADDCIRFTDNATKVHWDYVNDDNNVTLTMSYNATAEMNKACRLSMN